ncbi:S8 family serine peptidase [Mangrovivirga sp. M17]|uniref:S8 family serine peptidase n=1 Tax=Mangrovivirga halotolerans TaxID=2993936 RepID=A0ABT3RRG0_9BACT|nr:S8 family serine peptidase [Mangrovivirga halotolerans]MCX2744081.1 S8 family serine peptidase [Mangrovivirga halotolerans]
MNKLFSLYLILIISTVNIFGQKNRYFVKFKDKKHSSYSLETPQEFLSERAIDRRNKFGIDFDSLDLPVSEAYIDSLKKESIYVFYTSKWLNGAIVQIEENTAEMLSSKNFVDTVIFAAPGFRLTTSQNTYPLNEDPLIVENANNLSQDNQNNLINYNKEKVEQRGNGIRIAVFDGGFKNINRITAFNHLYGSNKLIDQFDFIENEINPYHHNNDHGTKVLSLISAFSPGIYLGLAYEAEICLYVTEDYPFSYEYRIEEYYWVIAAERADSAGVDIINSSLGYNTFEDATMDYEVADIGKNVSVSSMGAKIAVEKGIFTVVSSGNSGNSSSWPYTAFPADTDGALSVGAVDNSGNKAGFSSIGYPEQEYIKPDISTPGSQVVVINSLGNVTTSNGTSFSAPIATGMAALTLETFPEYPPVQLKTAFHESGSQSEMPDRLIGYGVPDLMVMLGEVLSIPEENKSDIIKLYPNPANPGLLKLKVFNENIDPNVEIKVFNNVGGEVVSTPLKLVKGEGIIDLTGISPGNYIVIVRTNQGNLTGKVILTD